MSRASYFISTYMAMLAGGILFADSFVKHGSNDTVGMRLFRAFGGLVLMLAGGHNLTF